MSKKLKKSKKELRLFAPFIGPGSDSNKYYCESWPEGTGNDHFTKKNGDRFEKAIADAVDAIQNTIRKAKERQMDRSDGNLDSSVNLL